MGGLSVSQDSGPLPLRNKFLTTIFGGYMRFRLLTGLCLLLALGRYSSGAEDTPLLVQAPTLSKTEIVFAYGGYLWSVPRNGGNARQLTNRGHENGPQVFPGWRIVALTWEDDGNMDVFVMPADSGE